MKRLRPYLGVGLTAWLASASPAVAQGDFYIELRGPESTAPVARDAAPALRTPVPAPIVVTAANGRYGPTRSTDTLWTVAAKYTRAPATVQQTMVALYYLNPRAFVRGNINNLQRGVQLRIPTASQARQRSAREAEAEFRRLSQQGNRRVTRAATPPQPVAQVNTQPVAAPKPIVAPVAARPPAAAPASAPVTHGLTEPKAATVAASSAQANSPAQAEDLALNRLQLQLMDELREQVSMSNEQLAALADNNQALRQHLTQLTAEVEQLKASRTEETAAASASGLAEEKKPGWLADLLTNPLNLALILILPALLLLALFTLWWRNRERRELAAQEQALSESSSLMLDDERDEFDDLFSASADNTPDAFLADEPQVTLPEQDVDEDAFARFLAEQQRLEEEEAQRQLSETADAAAVADQEPDLDPLFEDEMTASAPEPQADPLFEDEMAAFAPVDAPDADKRLPDIDALFDDEAQLTLSADTLSDAELDDLFNPKVSAAQAEEAGPGTLATTTLSAASLVAAAQAKDSSAADEVDLSEQAWLTSASDSEPDYVSVDELMAQAERSESLDPERERKLDLELELDEYASVIGQGQGVDIDADEGGVGAQMDLARAYIEIDDLDSARDLLNEALERGNAEQQRDARKLLQRLDKRG